VDIVVGFFAILLAAVIGFAVHRASLCNVKAVAELLTSKRAHMLGSFFKTMLWVIAVTFVIEFFLHPVAARPLHLRGFSLSALTGGFVFGVGAAVNGGCALGTLGRLGSGELRMLFTLFGSWAYTRTARTAVNHVIMDRPAPQLLYWLLFAAVLAGVVLSSLTNKSFVFDGRIRLNWLLNVLGGILMGVGATLIPGGNDALILHSIPGGSPHALPAYGALLVGTAAGLMVVRALGGSTTRIECTGDICRTQPVPSK
jgi:uncharacterized membrane protein YedE/YeeE